MARSELERTHADPDLAEETSNQKADLGYPISGLDATFFRKAGVPPWLAIGS
jgi:hypothetical protein